MTNGRRTFLLGTLFLWLRGSAVRAQTEKSKMYGLIGKMTAIKGEGARLAAILVEGVTGMPGCRSYVVAHDPVNQDVLWITEVWSSKEAHAASLGLPSVQSAIKKGRPLIAGMETVTETRPVGGSGLSPD